MLCAKCGANCAEGTTYCIHCGNRVGVLDSPQPQAYSYSYNNNGGGGNANPNANPTAQNSESNEPVSVGDWVLTIFLQSIPVVGIIMMFIWGFGGDAKKSKSNYCKAALIWIAIGAVLWIFMVVAFASLVSQIVNEIGYLNSYYR